MSIVILSEYRQRPKLQSPPLHELPLETRQYGNVPFVSGLSREFIQRRYGFNYDEPPRKGEQP